MLAVSLLGEHLVAFKDRSGTCGWGMGALQVILATPQSSKEGREIKLSHQVPAWE